MNIGIYVSHSYILPSLHQGIRKTFLIQDVPQLGTDGMALSWTVRLTGKLDPHPLHKKLSVKLFGF